MKKTDIVYVLSALYLMIVTAIYLIRPDIDWLLFSSILYIITTATVPIASFWLVGYHGLGSLQGKTWLAFGLMGLMDFLGETSYSILDMMGVIEWPGIPDIFYLGGYPFLVIFIALAVFGVRKLLKKRDIAIVSIIGILGCIPFVIWGMLPIFEWAAEATFLELAVSFAYPIMDFIVVFGVLLVFLVSRAFGGGRIAGAYLILTIALLLLVMGDLWWCLLELEEAYFGGHPVDAIFYFLYLLMALSPFYQRVVLERR